MTTSAENGDVITLSVALTGGTLVAVAGETDFSISRSAAEIDTDTKGDTSTPNMPSRQKVTCSVSSLYVHSDNAQQRLITQMKANGQVTLEMNRSGSAFESATATITSLELVHTDKAAATFSAEFAVDGDFA
jgi:predicted secreted protein